MQAKLILEDGTVYHGWRFGAVRDVVCEMVFNTGLTGYLELITDASYARQGLIMTAPLIGNYGVFRDHGEAPRPWADALIVRDLGAVENDARQAEDLSDYLRAHDIPGLRGVDTRSLTLHLREKGTMRGMIASDTVDLADALTRIRAFRKGRPVESVSCRSVRTHAAGSVGRVRIGQHGGKEQVDAAGGKEAFEVALLDLGLKQSIVWHLTQRGCKVNVYPWDTSAETILDAQPDGVVLSNGPGDPAACDSILPAVRTFYDRGVPLLAICLGHQLLGLATGAKTKPLKYGHRGINHPVKDLSNNRVTITSQNHGYVIMEETIDPAIAAISHVHVNDGSVEGLRYPGKPIISVQYHPEGAPGPLDSEYLFDEFLTLLASGKE